MVCLDKSAETSEYREQLYAKGGPLEYLSASRVNCWQQCRRKFYYRYLEKLSSSATPALHLGKVVHATLQSWNHARWSRKQISRDKVKLCFDRHWDNEQQLSPVEWKKVDEESKQRELAWSCLEAYLESGSIPEGEAVLAVEVKLDTRIEGLPPLIGIVDLVREGGVIVDFKTAAKTPNLEVTEFSHGLQLTIYALLFREATGWREKGIELHHIVKTKQPKVVVQQVPEVDDEKLTELENTLRRFVRAVEEGDWSASPNFMCGSCEYFQHCKQWKGGKACT